MLTEGLWRSQFGADPSIVGRPIQLDAEPYTVVGVLPADLRLPLDYASRTVTEIWVPLALGPNDPQERGNHGLYALGRLRAGATLRQAQAELDTITRGFFSRYPNTYDPEFGVTLVSAPREVFGDVRPALVVLLLAVGAVLLIACANVANLLLARSEVAPEGTRHPGRPRRRPRAHRPSAAHRVVAAGRAWRRRRRSRWRMR